jgi:hypothetical protein
MENELTLKFGIGEDKDERGQTVVGGKIVTNFAAVNKNLGFTEEQRKVDELAIPEGSMF